MRTLCFNSWLAHPLVVILLAVLLAPGPAAAGLNEWTTEGPYGGDIAALAIDPLTPSTLYAGTAPGPASAGSCAGVYRSTDGGDTWTPIHQGLAESALCVNALVIDPTNPDRLFAGTGGGVYRSTDGGGSWELVTEALWVLALALDPQTPSNLYAGTSRAGVLRSTDGGESWAAVNNGLVTTWIPVLLLDPHTPSTLYAGYHRSTDGGESWEPLPSAPPSLGNVVAIDPQTPTTLYAAVGDWGAWEGVYRSTDGGETWTSHGLAHRHVNALAIDPETLSLYAATDHGVFRSTDGGETWADGGLFTEVLTLALDPRPPAAASAATLYAGALDAGVHRSFDGGVSWIQTAKGFPRRSIRILAIDPPAGMSPDGSPPLNLYATTDRGVFRSGDGGRSWEPRNRGLGDRRRPYPYGTYRTLTMVGNLVVDPQVPANLYVGASTQGIRRSTDGGASWTRFQGPGDAYFAEVLAIAPQPDGPSILYWARGELDWSVYRGQSRIFVSEWIYPVLALAPSDPATIYACCVDAQLHRSQRSTDGGDSWTVLADGPAGAHLLAVDPVDPFTVYAAAGSGEVHRSTDGGESWARVGRGLGGLRIYDLAIDPRPGAGSALYAGTEPGVYRSIDAGESWWRLAELPADVGPAGSLAFDPQRPVLYAGTGRGVFDLELVDTLELHGGRFRVDVEWREFRDLRGRGSVASVVASPRPSRVPLRSRDSAVLEFFGSDNWELLIKILDGRGLNDHFWLFFAAATNVGYTLRVTDTRCGLEQVYANPLGRASPAVTNVEAFPDCPFPSPPSCEAGNGTLCLGEDGRFRVELEWRDFLGNAGTARQVRIPQGGLAASDDTGLFYFFGAENWELLVKVLDGCAFNDHFWVLSAATTNVEYRIRVFDTATGELRTYDSPLGSTADAVTDVEAFAGCDAPG